MNIKFTCLTLFIAVLFASCSHLYEPALYHQDIAYQPKPASFDTTKAANYVSGGLYANSNTHYNDFLVSGQFNLSRGYVFNNFNLAYGAFGVFGDYQSDQSNHNAPNYFSDKFFGAVGGRFSANAFVTSGRTDFRFIGVEMAYSHEFGSYADYRQYLNTKPGYFVDPRTNLFTIGLTSEVYFHNINDVGFQHGIRLFLGTTVGYNELNTTYFTNQTSTEKMFNSIFPKVSYFIKVKDFFGTVEAGENFFIRFGYKF
ncbi:hypothetical protein JN11_04749 [Mucilaginibacter frigoritolerans]|uniref:Outer membrane protein with beta-barrel domain n=1 Tax=Mucilaginibacter frigoritolerans TaxID=652788 RepID=A0A562TM98_9SPHI|nr:hypothetical protein [Mucilaginibacter frigoritolerans]TWI94358.1 hypothetical protein JN11_04749 [Mucilaginibacter frigoritolerans]